VGGAYFAVIGITQIKLYFLQIDREGDTAEYNDEMKLSAIDLGTLLALQSVTMYLSTTSHYDKECYHLLQSPGKDTFRCMRWFTIIDVWVIWGQIFYILIF
jgi:hypothetical protein